MLPTNSTQPGKLNTSAEAVRISLIFLYVALAIFIVVVNLFTIVAISKSENLKEKYGLLLSSLCTADAAIGLSIVAFSLDAFVLPDDVICELWYEFYYGLLISPTLISQLHSVILTIDRFIAVEFALQYHNIVTPLRHKVLIASAWIMGCIEVFLIRIFYHTELCPGNMSFPVSVKSIILIIHMTFTFLINGILYSRIWWIARKHKQKVHDNDMIEPRRKDRATLMIFVIVVLSYLLWCPYLINQFLEPLFDVKKGTLLENALDFTSFLGFTSCIINNVVYAVMNKDFRNAYKHLIRISITY
jgi:histamine receptor H2